MRPRLKFIVIQLLLCVFILEGGSRLFWKVKQGVPLSRPGDVRYYYYPELLQENTSSRKLKDPLRILVLGASAMHPDWGAVVSGIKEELMRRTRRDVVMINLARPGHTSLDSLWKYEWVEDVPHDALLVYHGINDARANNCPSEVFKPDYSHYSWYREINALRNTPRYARNLMFPFTLKVLLIRLHERAAPDAYLQIHEPRKDWLEYGMELKTSDSFASNLQALCLRAAQNDVPVFLGTFASWIPPNYSRAAFRERSLDYASHESFVEMWGTPDAVNAAINEHNNRAVDISNSGKDLHLVEIAESIQPGKQNFNDVCHFTVNGSAEAAKIWTDALLAIFTNK